MKKIFLSAAIAFFAVTTTQAQKVFTKNGNISFFSKTALENISADNNEVVSVFNKQTGEMQFSVIIKSFQFKKSLMQEHFNENYMESGKYPKSTFKGVINDVSKIDFSKDGVHKVSATGDLTIHGVTQKVTAPGTLTIKGGIITAQSVFNVKLSDYNITVPKVVRDNIAESIEITVNNVYDQKM